MRSHWVQIVTLLLAGLMASPAAAQGAGICTRLQAQLASLSTGPGTSAAYRRYAEAVAKQDRQLDKVRSDLMRYGCSSGSLVAQGGRNASGCLTLERAQTRMQANLRALERKRDSFGERGNGSARRRIDAAIKANGCDGPADVTRTAAIQGIRDARRAARSPGLVAILGDSGGRVRETRSTIIIEPHASGSGGYRTLCVRSCDGFFFPISSAASPNDFARDERTCRMMCPGTPAELYYHSVPDQESEDMVSARDNEPYTELPTAFAYRSTAKPMSQACSCNMAAFYQEMQRREAILNGTQTEAPVTTWVRPSARPDPGEDPETNANPDAELSGSDMAAVAAASQGERPLDTQSRPVRVVGPQFLPDQSQALDLTQNTDRIFR
ncbi:uncharacterized protein DUF2865 [Hoeflea marina]|uniref:Uncharacterized protein DUF2865 n=1 Tax=Hoeflea marina TaxID=274592 RepID=A0A317PSI7_9HYPH|nr:DUF2865 domain-containing protein [Hoeflea marina]PWW04441.1 uncharacterized protein DUF2865 [Hoeflea marina]